MHTITNNINAYIHHIVIHPIHSKPNEICLLRTDDDLRSRARNDIFQGLSPFRQQCFIVHSPIAVTTFASVDSQHVNFAKPHTPPPPPLEESILRRTAAGISRAIVLH